VERRKKSATPSTATDETCESNLCLSRLVSLFNGPNVVEVQDFAEKRKQLQIVFLAQPS
jgi:hypothetical protein